MKIVLNQLQKGETLIIANNISTNLRRYYIYKDEGWKYQTSQASKKRLMRD